MTAVKKIVREFLRNFNRLGKEEQYEIKRQLLKKEILSDIRKNADKYADEKMSEEEVMKEVKAVRNARKKRKN